MLQDEIFDESIPYQFIFSSPSDSFGVSQTKPHASHITDISHFEVVKSWDTHEESLVQQPLEPAKEELSSEAEDEMVLPYLFIFSNVYVFSTGIVNCFGLRCCDILNAKFKLRACNAITNIHFNVGKQIEETKPSFWAFFERLHSRQKNEE